MRIVDERGSTRGPGNPRGRAYIEPFHGWTESPRHDCRRGRRLPPHPARSVYKLAQRGMLRNAPRDRATTTSLVQEAIHIGGSPVQLSTLLYSLAASSLTNRSFTVAINSRMFFVGVRVLSPSMSGTPLFTDSVTAGASKGISPAT